MLPTARGSEPQIVLSRTRPEFVIRLFEQEVPEVYERIVEIKGIAREPGARTKIAVVSHDAVEYADSFPTASLAFTR